MGDLLQNLINHRPAGKYLKLLEVEPVENNNKNVASLKREIIKRYVEQITDEMGMLTRVLADKDWASTDCDYHRKCRADALVTISEIKRQIKVLS